MTAGGRVGTVANRGALAREHCGADPVQAGKVIAF
jgi:hypothetical protein